MTQSHWTSWSCPFCPSTKCLSPSILRHHVSLKHFNEVPSSKLDSFVLLCGMSDSSQCRGMCPLCSVFEIQTPNQYQSHIDQHLMQLTSSVFSDFPGKVASDETEDSIKHSSEPFERTTDIGTSFTPSSSADTSTETAGHYPEGWRTRVSSLLDQLKSISISKPTLESSKEVDACTVDSAVEQTHSPKSRASASEGSVSPPAGSLSSYSTYQSDSTAITPRTASPGAVHQSSNRSTQMMRPQADRGTSNARRSGTQTSYASFSKHPTVVYLWSCCYCGHGPMITHMTPACTNCGVVRCGNCHVETHRVNKLK